MNFGSTFIDPKGPIDNKPAFFHVMTGLLTGIYLFGATPLPEPMMTFLSISGPSATNVNGIWQKVQKLQTRKCLWNRRLLNGNRIG